MSEIRSPRMARRIERNANAPGVSELPRSPLANQNAGPLPPSALAAMQPQLPVQVNYLIKFFWSELIFLFIKYCI